MKRAEIQALAEQLETDAHGLAPIDFDDFTPAMREAAAIEHGAEGLGHCPRGKCAMPLYHLTGVLDG